jgi:hypothetical protein
MASKSNNMSGKLLLAGGALVVAGVVVYLGTAETDTKTKTTAAVEKVKTKKATKPTLAISTNAGPVGLSFKPGDRLGYDLRIRSEYSISAGEALTAPAGSTLPRASKSTREVKGQLYGHILSERLVDGVKTWTVASLMHNVTAMERDSIPITAMEEGLTLPILFEFNEQGRITGIAGNPATRVEIHNEWQLLLQLMEFALPENNSTAKTWTASQMDSTGVYSAQYKRVDQLKLARIQRERTAYTDVYRPGGSQGSKNDPMTQVSAEILHSDAVAVWTPNQKWFYEMRLREHMKLRLQNRTLGEADTTLSMKLVDPSKIELALWSAQLEEGKFDWRRSSQLALPAGALPYSNRAAIPGLADKTLPDVLLELNTFLNIKPQADYDKAITLLVQYLRIKPEMAGVLLDEIRKGGLPDALESLIFLGLELAGGDIAHATLVEAVHDGELSRMNRMRATSALGDVPDPNRSVVDRMLEIANSGARTEDEREVQRSAKLGLGVLAGNERLDKESRQFAHDALEEELTDSSDVNDITLALDSIGNSKDSAFKEQVLELTDHESPIVQVSAYRNLDKIGALPPAEELLERFRKEENSQIKRELAGHLVNHDKMEDTDIEVAITWLKTYPETDVRRTLINIIGQSAESNPEAKASLIAHYAVEKDVKLKVLIGKFVGAADLQ